MPSRPLPVIAGVFRTVLHWSGPGGQSAINVMHIDGGSVPSAAVMAALDAHVTSAMWAFTSGTFSVTQVSITPLDGITATSTFTPATPANWTGGISGDVIPATAALVKFTTSRRGRSFRGRLYMPGVTEAVQNGGVLDPSNRTTAQAAWATFTTTMSGSGFPIVVASYKMATSNVLFNVLVEGIAATQRRRQGRLR